MEGAEEEIQAAIGQEAGDDEEEGLVFGEAEKLAELSAMGLILEEEAALVGAHFLYLKGLFEQGVARSIGRTEEAPFVGLMVFDADSREAAQAIVDADPAVSGGVFVPTLSAYKVIFP